MSDLYLTPEEIANQIRVSKMTVYRLIHSGELTAIRIGRSLRVPETAWRDYLRRQSGRAVLDTTGGACDA